MEHWVYGTDDDEPPKKETSCGAFTFQQPATMERKSADPPNQGIRVTREPLRTLKAISLGHGSNLTRRMRAHQRIWTHPNSKFHLRLLLGIGHQRWEMMLTSTKTHRFRRE